MVVKMVKAMEQDATSVAGSLASLFSSVQAMLSEVNGSSVEHMRCQHGWRLLQDAPIGAVAKGQSDAKRVFLESYGRVYWYPESSLTIDKLRATGFARLNRVVYVDHDGATLHVDSLLQALQDLSSNLYGNPRIRESSIEICGLSACGTFLLLTLWRERGDLGVTSILLCSTKRCSCRYIEH